jgi:putative copper resistance protein D
MELANIGVRFAQYASLLSLFGLAAFAIYAPAAAGFIPRGRGVVTLAVVGLLASLAGIFVLAANMTGDISSATDPPTLWAVISGTGAGYAWVLRIVALVVALGVARFRSPVPLLIASGLAAASLAWGGHAAAEGGAAGIGHLAADIVHILAAGVWIGALAAFLRLLVRGGECAGETARALAAFSGVGSAVVAVLIGTGLVNSLYMVDWRPLPVLTTSPWGWLLLAKLALFGAMLGMAAVNRFLLTPRLQAEVESGGDGRLSHLKRSLVLEASLALGVVALISVLGTIAPPGGGGGGGVWAGG